MKSVGELSKICSQIVLKWLYLARIGRPDILWSENKLAWSITKWTKACDKRLNRLISYIHHTCEYKQYCHVGVCSQIVLKCLYLARIGRPDILWSVNKLARSITKWTKACDKRLNRLISYIHHTCEYEQYCYVSNTAKQCRLGLFQDSDFAGDLEDSKSTSGGTLCVFGSHTFCSNKLDVQETNCCFWQFNGIRNHFLGRRRIRVMMHGETRLWTNVRCVQHLTQFKNERNLMEWLMI